MSLAARARAGGVRGGARARQRVARHADRAAHRAGRCTRLARAFPATW